MNDSLIDTAEIAKIIGVTREHVTDRLTKQPDFPAPALNRSQRLRRWRQSDVLRWAGMAQSSADAISEADTR